MQDRKSKLADDLDRAFSSPNRKVRWLARWAGDGEAEDLIQDAFLKVIETGQREEVRKVDNLLVRVVRCLAIDRLRRRAVRMELMLGEGDEGAEEGAIGAVVDTSIDPERSLMGAQRLQRVLAAIDAMPARRREVFLMHRVEDLTYPQIARKIGISLKAVEKHIGLALKQLAESDD